MNNVIKYHTDKSGAVKYYANHRTAWAAASRLNSQTDIDAGLWVFEADVTGWFVFLVSHGKAE